MTFQRLRKSNRRYALREEGAKWVEKHLGGQYVDEFLDKYDTLMNEIPIGNFGETVVFLDLLDRIGHDIAESEANE